MHCARFLVALLIFPCAAKASYLALEANQFKQTYFFNDQEIELSPQGHRLSLDVDLSEQLSIGIAFGDWDDNDNNQRYSAQMTLEDKQLSISYMLEDWSFNGYFATQEDNVEVTEKRLQPRNGMQLSDSDNYGLGVNYGIELSNEFYLMLLSGIQRSEWSGVTTIFVPDRPDDQQLTESDSTTAMLGTSLSWQQELGSQQYLTIGGSVSWYKTLSGEQNLLQRNRAGSQRGFSVSLEDSYGVVSVYGSWDIDENWAIDVGFDSVVGSDENNNSSYLGIGYYF